MHIPTLHHPELSLLQAALHDVLQRRGDAQAANMSGTHPLMQELVATARGFTQPGRGGQLPTPSSVLTCAELAVHWVFAHGAEKQLLYDELKGSTCDPCWFQAIEA
ncbi:MAG TPA: hypothetical protein VFQ45_21980, partial [Longimicrobium sp.]|nr:hypothetical protein [Longimicrobium sp.]